MCEGSPWLPGGCIWLYPGTIILYPGALGGVNFFKPSWPMRGRRGGKTGPQNPPLGWPNAAGASPCCGALPWRGKGNALFSLYPVVPGHCEMGALRQCPGVRLGPGAASLATRGRSRRLGVGGPGPLAPGTGHKPALLPKEHPRLKSQPNHAPLSGTWGTFFL